jgi:hypothetical protein
VQHANNTKPKRPWRRKLKRGWRRTPLVAPEDDGQRWTRQSLAEAWQCSERKVDRIRKSGMLGEPIGKIGKTDLYSNAQKQAAERAGLAAEAA